MKKVGIIILITMIFSILESSFNYELFGAMLNPNLIIALFFAFLMNLDDHSALLTGLVGGLFFDLLSINIVGISSASFFVFIYLSIFIKKTIFKGNFIQFLLVVIFTLVYRFLLNTSSFQLSFDNILGAVSTAMCSLIFLYIISKFSTKYLSVEFRIKA